ncbi:MAG: PQQ-binding-like beta-propeller repeat protein [Candidatus Eremiobacteraeota bacterium]|nr:PQQ-binding-like beta-propeller repeat protein [Candidatus Eremiobacteraeota bacterium]
MNARKQCAHCGKPHSENAKFCPVTGHALTGAKKLSKAALRQPTVVIPSESLTQPIQMAPAGFETLDIKAPPPTEPPPVPPGRDASERCPLCQGFHRKAARFCSTTGRELFRRACPLCGKEVVLRRVEARFCPCCGGDMKGICPYEECKSILGGKALFCPKCLKKVVYCLNCRQSNRVESEKCRECQSPLPVVPGQWLTFQGDNGRTGLSRERISFPLYLKWTFPDLKEAVRITASPLAWRGVLFIATHGGSLYALNQYNGEKIWVRPTSSALVATPAIDEERPAPDEEGAPSLGRVYIATMEGKVFKLDASSGGFLWVYPQLRNETLAPIQADMLVEDDLVYVATSGGEVLALDKATGSPRWRFSDNDFQGEEHGFIVSPALSKGILVVISRVGYVWGLDGKTGAVKWRFPEDKPMGARVAGAPAISEGIVFIGDGAGNVYALSIETGQDTWHLYTQVEGGINASLAVGADLLFAGTWAQYLYALGKLSGGVNWRFRNEKIMVNDAITSPPLILGSGAVLFCSQSGYVYALDMEGRDLWSYRLEQEIMASPLVSDGHLYVAGCDGICYAFTARRPQKGEDLLKVE